MSNIIIKPLSIERYEAFIAYSRKPHIKLLAEELEYWSDSKERVIGFVSLYKADSDYSIVILGRDEIKRFRPIWLQVSIKNIDLAREILFKEMEIWSNKNDSEYYQNDCTRQNIDVFKNTPNLAEEKLHPSFKVLRDGEGLSAAKGIIEEILPHYIDIDGNQFAKQFQTTGFDQRLWELYLFCFLNENLFERDTSYYRPDFCVNKFDNYIGIEALTLGKPQNANDMPSPDNSEEFQRYMRQRYSKALRKKLNHKPPYWTEPHLKDKPFVLAIADFNSEAKINPSGKMFEAPSFSFSRPALEQYLYGGKFEKTKDSKDYISNELIPFDNNTPAFFDLPNSENISAVLFSNLGTIGKFNRMGKIAGFGSNRVKILQIGEIYNPDPKADKPMMFASEVEPGKHFEYWDDGISFYHNPKAKFPLDKDLFPYCIHEFIEGNKIVTQYNINSIHPYWSLNQTIIFK